ncbi:MAG: serine/threonine-protein phosphatase [Armatimonadetes bacterium]|nr:serine/threonine-protein phosphatase [Armatimonadota bacterium]
MSWKTALGTASLLLTPEISNTVWELMVLCVDNLTAVSADTDDEITKVAYDLAAAVLQESDVRTLHQNYRNLLIEAILKFIPTDPYFSRRMIHFANLLSDAYREAYADRLRRLIAHQRASRLSEELHMAKQVQERLLPKVIPQVPGFQIAGRVVPAEEVGGDYWSAKYYEDDDIVTTKLVDISGHGIAAATLVAAVKFISGGYYRGSESASEVIERTNRVLVKETPVEILVTMVYGWLHPKTKEVDVVNAGHEPVFLCKDGVCTNIPPTGPVLGAIAEATYSQQTLKLEPGSILFFCSDGITEAGAVEQFGADRVRELVAANRHRSADEIADVIIQSATEFAGKPHDDMSLVVVKALDEESE